MSKIFISHANRDSDLVVEFLDLVLRGHGLSPWYAMPDIEPATDWEGMIQTALQDCQYLLVVLSEKALASKWVKAEVFWWVDERLSPLYPLIPLVIDKCSWQSIHLVLRTIQIIDWSSVIDTVARVKSLERVFGHAWCPQLSQRISRRLFVAVCCFVYKFQ